MANTVIGRVLATEKNPTTIDDFTFWTDPKLILNPFDIVKVQHVNNSFIVWLAMMCAFIKAICVL